MKNRFQKQTNYFLLMACLSGTLLLLLGLLLSLTAHPALANPLAQGATGTPTGTVSPVATNTPTVAGTVAATGTVTATATLAGTLPPPAVTGTPTVLVPVTGADLTSPGSQAGVGIWIALWLVGLLLIGYGLRSKFGKQ
jgi:hypothetical protein